MNVSILVASFQYLNKFENVVKLSICFYNLLFEERQDKNHKFKLSYVKEDYEISKLLVSTITETKYLDQDYTYMFKPSIAKHIDLLTILIQRKLILCFFNIMISSCMHGYTDTVRLLISMNCYKVNKGNSQSLIEACKSQHKDIVKILLDANATSDYAITVCLENHNVEILELLILKDFCKDRYLLERTSRPLVTKNKLEAVKVLIKNKVTLDAYSLFACCDRSLYEMIQLLIDAGHKIDYKHFDIACKNNDIKIFNLLKTNDKNMYHKWMLLLKGSRQN